MEQRKQSKVRKLEENVGKFSEALYKEMNALRKDIQECRDKILADWKTIEENYERVKDNYPDPNEELVEKMMGLIATASDRPDIIRGALWALLREAVPIEE